MEVSTANGLSIVVPDRRLKNGGNGLTLIPLTPAEARELAASLLSAAVQVEQEEATV